MHHYLFRCDDQMWPSQINATLPGAQFVARGSMAADGAGTAGTNSDPVWGILLEVPGERDGAVLAAVETDDGRTFEAVISSPVLDGDLEALLAVARYWELPPVFIAALKHALAAAGKPVEDEEPRDDAQLP